MYGLTSFGGMIADSGRLSAYSTGLEKRVARGSVVLDLGAGTGIMSLLACRAGAARVYAVEPNDAIHLAEQAAAANGFGDRIRFIRALSTDIELPERVDGIVADLRGVLPLLGSSLPSIIDARNRFLKPAGWIIAARDTLWAALVSSQKQHDAFVKGWTSGHSFDFSHARERSVNTWERSSVTADDVFGAPCQWASIDYRTVDSPGISGDAVWTVEGNHTAYGVAVWFDTETAPGIGLSNSPFTNQRHVYRQGFFPWPTPTELCAGDEVRVRFRAHYLRSDYNWTWDTLVTEPSSGAVRAKYRQSTFLGAPLAPDRLRKREHAFVADLNGDAAIDRRILELMEQKLSLARIADRLLEEFPLRLTNWDDALTRAGDISERYSR